MLTDDDLTRQLGHAFRDATGDLAYGGRVPAPRSTLAAVGVPLASSAAVIGALAVVWASSTETDDVAPPSAGPSASTAPASPTAPAPRLVTDTIEVAGFTFTYRHGAGSALADDLYAKLHPGAVPEDAEPISAPEGVKAWVGTDPASGDHAVYVQAPTRNGGDLFALLSPTWTTDQLSDLFHNGRPRTVPAVS